MLADLHVELPQCNIQQQAPLSQKVKIIIARENNLEETIEKMDAEHKARITELEAKQPGTLPEEREARFVAVQSYATTIELHLDETQKLLDEGTSTWTTMEDIDALVEGREALQKN